MDKRDLLISKLEELVTYLNNGFGTEMIERWEYEQKDKLESEIATLKAEVESEKEKLMAYGIWCGHEKHETEESVNEYLKNRNNG